MTYERKAIALGASLTALLAIWGAGLLFSPERRMARAESRSLLSGDSSEAVTIELGQPRLTLSKKDGSWFLVDGTATLPAREERIKSFLSAVSSVRRLRPVARSKDAWKSLGLGEGEARPVAIRDAKGRALADFLLGGRDPAGSDVFLRLGAAEASYAADGALSSYVSSDRRSWLDLRVLPGLIPDTDIEALSVRSSLRLDGASKPPLSLEYALRRDKDGWKGLAGEIDPVAVASQLRSIVNIEGEDFVTSAPSAAFSPVSARLELSLGNGGSRILEVGAQAGEGRFYLRLVGSPYVYTASAYALRGALKKPEDLVTKKR